MAKVLIINTPGLLNKGGMAAVMGAMACLRETMPDAQITALCHHTKEDWDTLQEICGRHQIEVKKHPWLKEHDSKLLSLLHSSIPAFLTLLRCVGGRIARRVGLRPKGDFNESDVVLGLDIDTLHDHYGIFFPIWTLSNLMLGIAAGKPVVVWGAGVGSFKHPITRLAARLVLNRATLIIIREEVSKKYLKAVDVTSPRIVATADHAFFMQPASTDRIDEIFSQENLNKNSRPLVGLAASQLIHRYAFPDISNEAEKYGRYVEAMTGMTDYLIDRLDADILLLNHVIMPSEDDRIISNNIRNGVKKPDRVRVLDGDYMADELKGVIARCDLFIGCRMHPTIASTSMAVPTIPLIYGEKAYGILGDMMGQADCMVEIARRSPDKLLEELKAKIDLAWENRDSIRAVLKERAAVAKEQASLNGSLVRELIEQV